MWQDVLAWGPDSWLLNWTTYRKIRLQEQYACAIRMIGELETAGHFATEKIIGPHIEKSVLYNFNLPVSI